MGLRQDFEARVMPHLDAAYNLARWLLRDEPLAQDAVQEASMRAFRYLESLQAGDARPWLLGIVRNTCFAMLERQRKGPVYLEFDDEAFATATTTATTVGADALTDPALQLQHKRARVLIDAAIAALSPPLREVLVLREFEDLDCAQIAAIAGIPVGTVMSRLARAREKLRTALAPVWQGQGP